jgi:hypothetical protein
VKIQPVPDKSGTAASTMKQTTFNTTNSMGCVK